MNENTSFKKARYLAYIGLMATSLGVDADTASLVMQVCAVEKPDQLYAKYVATGRADTLFARAMGVNETEWVKMMDHLREHLPPETIEYLDKPLTDDELPAMGYRPKSDEDSIEDDE